MGKGVEPQKGDAVNLIQGLAEFGIGVIIDALFKILQDFRQLASGDGEDKWKAEPIHLGFVQGLKALEFIVGAGIEPGVGLFRG